MRRDVVPEISSTILALAAIRLRAGRGDNGSRERLAQRFAMMATRVTASQEAQPEENESPAARCVRRALQVSDGEQNGEFWSALGGEVTTWIRDRDLAS